MNATRALLLGLTIAWLTSCASSPFPYAPPERQGRSWAHVRPVVVSHHSSTEASSVPPHRIVLITLDGIRWQEVFDGVDRDLAPAQSDHLDARHLLPNLYRLVDRGVALGHPDARHGFCTANEDHRSLPGYQELFAARPTRCVGNDCGAIECPTLFDHLRAHGWSRTRAAAITSWPTLRNAFGAAGEWFVTSTGSAPSTASTASTRGACRVPPQQEVEPIGAGPHYRADADTVRAALEIARTSEAEFLYVGFGDADENAHHSDYAHYLASLRAEDEWIGCLDRELAGPDGTGATIIVTTDHGRGWNFHDHGYWGWAPMHESDRTWLVAAGPGIRRDGVVDAARTIYLADVAPTIGALLGWSEAEWRVDGGACATAHGVPIREVLEGVAPATRRRSGRWRECTLIP